MKFILNSEEQFRQAANYIERLLKSGNYDYVAEIKRKAKNRTADQNRLLWLWLTCLEVDSEYGYTKDEFYDVFLQKFAPKKVCMDEEICVTSSRMDTKEMTDFLEKIRHFAQMEMNIYLPLPEERGFEDFYELYINQ